MSGRVQGEKESCGEMIVKWVGWWGQVTQVRINGCVMFASS